MATVSAVAILLYRKEVDFIVKHFEVESAKRKIEIFYKEPEPFTKYTERETLAYALGATLYMPALRESIADELVTKKYRELASVVIDLEDAVGDSRLEEAEQMLIQHISNINRAVEEQKVLVEELPLIFIRVRSPQQMKRVTQQLGRLQRVLTGYVFPKFSYEAGKDYLEILKNNNSEDMVLYGMPVLETADIVYKEIRIQTLNKIKELLEAYQAYILNIRIGATDFCGLYGIRRKVNTSIYDVLVIRDCLTDIMNLFNRNGSGFVLSGPVWEFFSNNQSSNPYLDGLMNEVMLDQLNGFIGKTIIHPTHIKPVHSLYVVSHEDYLDATSILDYNDGQVGVVKSEYANKMNEMKPHFSWAKRILLQAKVFGVYNKGQTFTHLMEEEKQFNEGARKW